MIRSYLLIACLLLAPSSGCWQTQAEDTDDFDYSQDESDMEMTAVDVALDRDNPQRNHRMHTEKPVEATQEELKATQEKLESEKAKHEAEIKQKDDRVEQLEKELKTAKEPVLHHTDPMPPPKASDDLGGDQAIRNSPENSKVDLRAASDSPPSLLPTHKIKPLAGTTKKLLVVYSLEDPTTMPLPMWDCQPCRQLRQAELSGQLADFDVRWRLPGTAPRGIVMHGWPHLQFTDTNGQGRQYSGWPGITEFRRIYRGSSPASPMGLTYTPQRWRNALPPGVDRTQAHTRIDAVDSVVPLPSMSLDITDKSLNILEGGEQKLNRWFSLKFQPTVAAWQSNEVSFRDPPEIRAHALPNGKGIHFDNINSIMFVSGMFRLKLKNHGDMDFPIAQ